MILVKTKAESATSSPLSLGNAKDEKPTLSFSELLRGAKDTKDEKGVQNGSLILSLGADAKDVKVLKNIKLPDVKDVQVLKDTKLPDAKDLQVKDIKLADGKDVQIPKDTKLADAKETLVSLLKNDDKALVEDVKVIELNPKITQTLSVVELKTLIADAKKFLKDKILDSVEYKKSEIKDLPKTLKGLAQVAQKFGIDVSKITLEEVSNTVKQATPLKLETKQVDATAASDVKEEKQTTKKATPKADTEDVVDIKVKVTKTKTEKSQVASDAVSTVKVKEETKELVRENIRVDDKKIEIIKETKSTPLFKAQEKTDFTTEQLVQAKQFKVEEKTPRSRADETLKLLLRGEKPTDENAKAGLTKDFSVATARVIAPSATTEVSKSIEQLLRGDNSEDIVKPEAMKAQDADGFDVKVKEAKQMMKYLSQDIKTAIEDYKSPFTRVKVQLNPAKMGEIDLTVVQRGKNLHVNLSSNNAAINTLSMNVNDLKAQLTNNGIQNATLNFSDSSQNSEQNAQQQQNRHNERQAKEEYSYFENEEQNEEILNSLEIVVSYYA